MSGNTYKWLGGQGTGTDPNDATLAANWLIEQSGSFVASVTTPGSGDIAFLDSGTADLLFTGSESADISGVTYDFGGAGATLSLSNVSLDEPSLVLVGAGDIGTLAIGEGVDNQASIEASGAGSTLDVALSGLLDNESVIVAENGGTVTMTPGSGGVLVNDGGVVAYGGDISVGAPVVGTGVMVVAEGTLALTVAVGGAQSVVFTEGPATLAIDDPEQFAAQVFGFQAGETIDLPTIHFESLQAITLVNNVATIADGFGDTLDLGIPGSGLTAGDFVATSDPGGGTELTVPGVIDPQRLNGVGGAWSTAGDWSTGAQPGTADTAIIANLGSTFEVSTSGQTTVGAVILLAPDGTLAVGGALDVARAIYDAAGTIAVAAGGHIVTKAFDELGGGATLTLAAALMTLNGGSALPNGNGLTALDVEGAAVLTGATLDAGSGSARIGWTGNGTMEAVAGSRVIASYTDLGGSGAANGSLVVDDSVWQDLGEDSTGQQAGEMLVGGGALGPSGFLNGGSGTLVIQDDAVATDAVGAIIGASTGSQGSATVQNGGTWVVDGNLTVGINLTASATLLVQQGIVAGGSTGTSGSIDVTGTLAVDGTLFVNGGSGNATALDFTGGTLGVDSTSVLNIGTNGPSGDSGLVIDVGASAMLGAGSFGGLLTVLGSLVTAGVTLNGTLAGPGTVDVASGTTLTIDDAAPWTTDIAFATGGNGDLALSDNAADQGLIEIPAIPQVGVANTIDLPGLTFDASRQPSYDPASDQLTLGGDSLAPITLEVIAPAGTQFTLGHDLGTGTDIVTSSPCYAAGTRLATPGGEVAVETLRAGDLVLALEGGATVPRPVRWVGRFTVDLAHHPAPAQAAPVRIAANAFAPGVPRRDLLVSPDHAILVDGALLQAQSLVNGATIRREQGRRRVTYLHVELERHGILLAEGLPAESYLDTGNRGRFAGEPGVRPLHPDFSAAQALEVWRERACARLRLDGPLVVAAHSRLKARAKALGYRLTADPALRVLADGVEAPLAAFSLNHWRARLPAGTRGVRLLTRCFVPTEIDPTAVDRRRLGLAMTALGLAGRALPESAYGAGWHAAEADWRWTGGDARLRLRPLRRPAALDLRAAPAGAGYWLETARTAAVVA